MKQKLAAAILILTILLLTGCAPTKTVKINNETFKVELANTKEARREGLMNRKSLSSNKGMLFIFDQEEVTPFWMKNTLIPLDIIWINSAKKIVHIHHNANPCKKDPCPLINPHQKAKYVLELNSGTANKIKAEAGTKVDFSI